MTWQWKEMLLVCVSYYVWNSQQFTHCFLSNWLFVDTIYNLIYCWFKLVKVDSEIQLIRHSYTIGDLDTDFFFIYTQKKTYKYQNALRLLQRPQHYFTPLCTSDSSCSVQAHTGSHHMHMFLAVDFQNLLVFQIKKKTKTAFWSPAALFPYWLA